MCFFICICVLVCVYKSVYIKASLCLWLGQPTVRHSRTATATATATITAIDKPTYVRYGTALDSIIVSGCSSHSPSILDPPDYTKYYLYSTVLYIPSSRRQHRPIQPLDQRSPTALDLARASSWSGCSSDPLALCHFVSCGRSIHFRTQALSPRLTRGNDPAQ